MDKYDLIWLITIIAAESVALYCVKKYSIDDNLHRYILLGIILYAYIPFALYKITKNGQGIAITNIIWNIASTIYGLLIGILLFDESISWEQKIGILLGFAGVFFMILKSKE